MQAMKILERNYICNSYACSQSQFIIVILQKIHSQRLVKGAHPR